MIRTKSLPCTHWKGTHPGARLTLPRKLPESFPANIPTPRCGNPAWRQSPGGPLQGPPGLSLQQEQRRDPKPQSRAGSSEFNGKQKVSSRPGATALPGDSSAWASRYLSLPDWGPRCLEGEGEGGWEDKAGPGEEAGCWLGGLAGSLLSVQTRPLPRLGSGGAGHTGGSRTRSWSPGCTPQGGRDGHRRLPS